MKLSSLITKKLIVTGLPTEGKSKKKLIEELLEHLFLNSDIQKEAISKKEALEALLAREEESSTGIGDGFAFPHARFPNFNGFYTLLAICPDGIDFDSLDKKKCYFFILSLLSHQNAQMLLKTRAAIIKFMMPILTRKALLEAKSPEDIWAMMDSSEIEVDYVIHASDIMTPTIGYITPEMTLYEASVVMHRKRVDSLPIVDYDGKFKGALSCYDLFIFGLPPFFLNLKTVSFVKNINPFEKYFHSESSVKVKDIELKDQYATIHPDATLLEIVFEMTTNKHHQLYVVKDEKLLGVINRFSVIDKVLVAG